MRRWPQWRLGSEHIALHDPESGILDIRRATAAHIALARDRGATILANAEVTAIAESAGGVRVTAGGQDYSAGRVVLAGGAWNPVLLAMLGAHLPITLTEEQVTYFATPKIAEFTPDRFGVYGYLADDGLYYGFPIYGEVATKIGIDGAGPVVTPETRTYAPDQARVRRVLAFLERYLPGAVGPELYTRTCCYDFPPDRDFIADYVPGSQRVLVCAGAGHAGKFAALLGRVLTELALDGSSQFRSAHLAPPALRSPAPRQHPAASTQCESASAAGGKWSARPDRAAAVTVCAQPNPVPLLWAATYGGRPARWR